MTESKLAVQLNFANNSYIATYNVISVVLVLSMVRLAIGRILISDLVVTRPGPIMLFKLPILSNGPKFSLLCPNYAPLYPIMLH